MQISNTNTFDVAVVGAGVFGAWTAFQIQQTGKQVILIDAHGAGNSRSSSGDESRIIRMGYGPDEIYTRSALRALRLWKEFFAEIGEQLFHQTGVLWLAHEDDPYPSQCVDAFRSASIPFEKLTTSEVTRRFPQFGLDGISWALFEPNSGALIARRAVQAVVREAIQRGAQYLQDAVVAPTTSKIKSKLDHIHTKGGQRISAGQYVFACGAWLPAIFPDMLAAKIHSTRQEVFYFGAPTADKRFDARAFPAWVDFKDEAYGLPDLEGRGIKIAIDRHGSAFDPENDNRVVTTQGLNEVRQFLARRLPYIKDAPVTETRVCQYENTSNGDFLIDLHPEFENVWIVGGGSGHGFKHGPVVGEYVAARIEGKDDDIQPRFSLSSKVSQQNRSVF